MVGLPEGGMSLRPGSPCDNFQVSYCEWKSSGIVKGRNEHFCLQGYCDVFLKCRAVDTEGPLARLKNLLFNKETLSSVAQWITVSTNILLNLFTFNSCLSFVLGILVGSAIDGYSFHHIYGTIYQMLCRAHSFH